MASSTASTEKPGLLPPVGSTSKVAKKYLSIPATLVPSERAFSTAGNIVNKKRACLQPSSVNVLVFLSENLIDRLH